jgi:uncharacterized protein involved in exopolysaccharide biosynthesis
MQENTTNDSPSLSIKHIINAILNRKTIIAIIAIMFALVGIFYSLLLPVTYSTYTKVLPEVSQGAGGRSMGSFTALAGLAGFDMDNANSTEAIRPNLYPDIIKSTPFLVKLLNKPVINREGERFQTLGHFLLFGNKKTPLKAGVDNFFNFFKEEQKSEKTYQAPTMAPEQNLVNFTKIQEATIKILGSKLNSTIDKKTGIITLTVVMSDPKVAGTVAQYTLDHLKYYITDYRSSKTNKYQQFLEERTYEAKRRFDKAQIALSSYKDRNKNIILLVPKAQEEDLKYEYDLSLQLYSDLTKKMEQNRLQVQNETPILKILEPASEPLVKSAPMRSKIVFTFALIGLIVGLAFALYKEINWSELDL